MKRAFTLIELLVVIAIIAILAAILFPVFAQAKVAAKGAAALSDTKQTSLAMLMYCNDSNDYWVNAASWNTGSDPLCYGANTCVSTWTWLVNPYMKNQDIVVDPLGPTSPYPFGKTLSESFNPTFGYDYNALAPYVPPGANGAIGHSAPLSSTGVDQPANVVMIGAKYSTMEWAYGHQGYWGLGFTFAANADNGPQLQTTMDPPDCGTINSYCIGNWGTSAQWAGLLVGNVVAGADTGGNSMRGTGASEIAFCDGHSKKLAAGALGAGTNWSTTLNANNLLVTDNTKYMWWAQPSTGN